MPESFGARLRQHREEQAIALVTVAEQTKIKLSLLEAVERDDVSQWPAGIFRRAFIRAYAHAIGLDPDVVVREFLEVHPERSEVVASVAATPPESARTNGGPPTRLRYLVGSAIGSLSLRRRSAAVDDPPPAEGPQVIVAAPAQTRLEAVAHPSPDPVENTKETFPEATPPNDPVTSDLDLLAVANLCTAFGRVQNTLELRPLLQEAARILDAAGLIVWIWDPLAEELRPALVHGYSDRVIAQLPQVRRDADNATAAAFRSADARAIGGGDHIRGALVVPLLTPAGCAGVLAIELQREREPAEPVRAAATIFAALLAQLIGDRVAETPLQAEMIDPAMGHFAEGARVVRPVLA